MSVLGLKALDRGMPVVKNGHNQHQIGGSGELFGDVGLAATWLGGPPFDPDSEEPARPLSRRFGGTGLGCDLRGCRPLPGCRFARRSVLPRLDLPIHRAHEPPGAVVGATRGLRIEGRRNLRGPIHLLAKLM